MDQQTPAQAEPSNPEDKTAILDFEPQEAPAGAGGDRQAGDAEAIDSLAGEPGAEGQQPDDDDREVILRDNRKVKISELKRGYRPEWTQEAQKYAQAVKQYQARAQGFDQQEQAYAQLLQNAVAFVQARLPEAPDDKLIDSDPFEYQRRKANYDTEVAKLGQLQQQQAAYHQHLQQKQQQQWQQYLSREMELARNALPDLKDTVKAAKWLEEVKALGKELGYTNQEMSQIHSHKHMKLINLALEGKRLKASLESAKEKLKEAREEKKAPPVQEPRTRRSPAQVRNENFRERLANLRKTGSARDAEAVLSQFD